MFFRTFGRQCLVHSRVARPWLHAQHHNQSTKPRRVFRRLASTQSDVHASIREAFADIRNSLSLVDQGERIKEAERQVEELEKELEDENIWTKDYESASRKRQLLTRLQKQTGSLRDIKRDLKELEELQALADSSQDPDLPHSILTELRTLHNSTTQLTTSLLLSHPADPYSAYIDIKAGSGGTEACDWALILSRMYERWATQHGFTVKLVEETPAEIAGVRSRTVLVEGAYVYGRMQFESGVHRLVRCSPFDSAGLRHTSFASVQVSPAFGEEEENGGGNGSAKLIELKPGDLKIQTMRSSGAGGQHVNKTESAVRITHIPTGIVVACQQERSQQRNRATAISLLKAKLFDMDRLKRAQEKATSHTLLPEMTWGAQIRSYTLQPYQLIKDTRTGHEVSAGRVQDVLDGELDGFLDASLKHFRSS